MLNLAYNFSTIISSKQWRRKQFLNGGPRLQLGKEDTTRDRKAVSTNMLRKMEGLQPLEPPPPPSYATGKL